MFWKKKEEAKPAEQTVKNPLPKHIAIDLEGVRAWAELHKVDVEEAYRQSFVRVLELIQKCVALNIPIVTFYIMSPGMRRTVVEGALLKPFAEFLGKAETAVFLGNHKIKITILGKWYDLSQQTVDAIRSVADRTKDYDSFFVNFCLNYDGQEEIVDACRLIARQVKLGKLDPDLIKKDLIKENVYSSYFIPPDLIVRNGTKKVVSSLLLWDSPGAKLVFSEKLFPDLSVEEFGRIVEG